MGEFRHHSIIITSMFDGETEKAHEMAIEIFGKGSVSESIPTMNGFQTFFIPPDGSKEYWSNSLEGDTKRNSYKEWLSTNFSGEWVEVEYGCEGGEQSVVKSFG